MNFVVERITSVFNAAVGRKANCKDVINLHDMDPQIANMLRELVMPERQAEILAEMEAQKDSTCECAEQQPSQCVHLDYIPVCHLKECDVKPERCAASTCPVRAYQVILEEMQKKAAMVAYG